MNKYQRIGVLTFFNTLNYGAMLQCFALNKYLNNMEYDSKVILYKCEAVTKREMPFAFIRLKDPKRFVKGALSVAYKLGKNKNFKKFREKNIVSTAKVFRRKDVHALNDAFDTFVVGSDQVWNPLITGNDMTFFLDFAEKNKKKVAYAASCGDTYLTEYYSSGARNMMQEFDHISVREAGGIGFIEELTGKTAVQVCDPVFLLGVDEWREVQIPVKVKKKYVLVYFIHYSYNETMQKAKEYAAQHDFDVIYINNTYKIEKNVINYRTYGPEQFLYLIDNAECVITGSFHGYCFSLMFHKRVFYEKSKYGGTRVSALAELVGFDDKIVDNISEETFFDYEDADSELKHLIASSQKYLIDSLEEKG